MPRYCGGPSFPSAPPTGLRTPGVATSAELFEPIIRAVLSQLPCPCWPLCRLPAPISSHGSATASAATPPRCWRSPAPAGSNAKMDAGSAPATAGQRICHHIPAKMAPPACRPTNEGSMSTGPASFTLDYAFGNHPTGLGRYVQVSSKPLQDGGLVGRPTTRRCEKSRCPFEPARRRAPRTSTSRRTRTPW